MPSAADVLASMQRGTAGSLQPDLPGGAVHGSDDDEADDQPSYSYDPEEESYMDEEQEEMAGLYGRGDRQQPALRRGKNGPREGAERRATPSPTTPNSHGSRASHSKSSDRDDMSGTRHRPRGNLPQAPSFDGDKKKDPKCFKHWVQRVDSYVETPRRSLMIQRLA